MAVQAMVDAADEDRATGGIDVVRGIYPIVNPCSEQGVEDVPSSEIDSAYREIMSRRENGRPS